MASKQLRALMACVPSSVAVITVDADGQRLGLTVGSLVALSLEPPLVAIGVSRQSAMHELLREAGGFAVSILAAGQEWLAQHFARGVPPIAMWHEVPLKAVVSGPPLLAGALGWLECGLGDELPAGSHTLFVGEVLRVELGNAAPPLLRFRGEYTSL